MAKSKGLALLKKQLPGLRELLTSPGYEGNLVLFYARGLQKFLKSIQKGVQPEELKNNDEELRFASAMANEVQSHLKAEGLERRVRFITPLDLGVILSRVNVIAAEAFEHFVLGKDTGIRYDVPKIPEAILRLRLLGSGVPVFRMDQDVLFSEAGQELDEFSLFKAIACSVLAYELRLRNPSVSSFGFSASYDTRALLGLKKANQFEAWGWAFATRVQPALTVDVPEIERICGLPKKKKNPDDPNDKTETQNDAWDAYAVKKLDNQLVRQYYGLRKEGLHVDGIRGLMTIGAHPSFAVISGALLCLSEGAIIDLPPFSNFRENVMWIDDHLKYSLHREMHHFTSGEKLNLPAGLEYARLDKVMVTKARPRVGDLAGYTLATYLPTVLWGAILDSWIVPNSILKVRFDSVIGTPLEDEWKTAQRNQIGKGILPSALLKALQQGRFTAENELKRQLMETAVKRVEHVRQLWSALRDGEKRTFASHWASGEVDGIIPKECFKTEHDPRLWKGIAPGRSLNQPLRRAADLGDMLEPIEELAEDTVDYIKWTLAWPQFVQIVRSVRQGEFSGDMSWPING